jgi:hypothetical protein
MGFAIPRNVPTACVTALINQMAGLTAVLRAAKILVHVHADATMVMP